MDTQIQSKRENEQLVGKSWLRQTLHPIYIICKLSVVGTAHPYSTEIRRKTEFIESINVVFKELRDSHAYDTACWTSDNNSHILHYTNIQNCE